MRERLAASGPESRAKRSKVNRDWRRRARLGISTEGVALLLAHQCHVCPGCDRPVDEFSAVDHCHTTGMVRGMLCLQCNTAVGLLEEDPARFQALVEYLEQGRDWRDQT
jgi:hypothetical protein